MNKLVLAIPLIMTLIISGCGVQNQKAQTSAINSEDIQIDNGKVLFVEQIICVSSESDDPDSFIGRWVDSPTYKYDAETRKITGLIDFDVSSTQLLLGHYEGFSGFSGQGAVSYLVNTKKNRLGGIEIIDSQGTVHWKESRTKFTLSDLSFHSKAYEVTLKVGESTTREYKVLEFVKSVGFIIHTVTETYVNHGLINKDDIQQ